MSDARTTIEGLLNTMREILLVAGVPKHQIRMRRCAFKINTCNKAFDWLHNIYLSPEYVELVKVYKLLPAEIWARYVLLEIEGLAEQLLLDDAKKGLLRLWRKQRPNMFGKDRDRDNLINQNIPIDSCRPGR